MPEQKMSYQERFNNALEVGLLTRDDAARESVASQAEAIRWALWKFYEDGEMRDDVDENMLSSLINEHLNSYGYIEPKTEEDGK